MTFSYPDDQTDEPTDPVESGDNAASFQPASWWGNQVRNQLQRNPNVGANVRGTIIGIVGSSFAPQEIDTLENRAIDSSNLGDQAALMGIQSGLPLTLSTPQWTTIDGLLRKMPQDPLGQRAYSAFKAGLASGKIRIR